jgi:hypothetical protein
MSGEGPRREKVQGPRVGDLGGADMREAGKESQFFLIISSTHFDRELNILLAR